MRKAIFILITTLLVIKMNVKAQVVADTFGNIYSSYTSISPFTFGWGSFDTVKSNYILFTQSELASKGIYPGTKIYGCGFHKCDTVGVPSTLNLNLKIDYRSGSNDTNYNSYSQPNINAHKYYSYLSSSISAPSYLIPYSELSLNKSFGFPSQYNNGTDFTFPHNSVDWYSFMSDGAFMYNGGSLEIHIVITGPSLYGKTILCSAQYGPFNKTWTQANNSSGGSFRPVTIIYHSPSPDVCNGIPSVCTISGNSIACKNGLNYSLCVDNASNGNGTLFQWQISTNNGLTWTNIPGATNAVHKYQITSPTQFRCFLTCSNSGLSSITSTHTVNPYSYKIDSISMSISGHDVWFLGHVPDTIIGQPGYPQNAYNWIYGNDPNPLAPTWFTYWSVLTAFTSYNVDSNYTAILSSGNYCNADSAFKTFYIGCPGSLTFKNTISASADTNCPGNPVTLKINDTLPANYYVDWLHIMPSGNYILPGSTGPSISVYPGPPNTIYRCAAICSISGNFKYSNYDTVYLYNPSTAGTIQAQNTTGNYYNFTNSGMNNAQSFTWYFGDGDSSISLSPNHHYNLSGIYNVAFVTKSVNGCTDTAFTTVNITTGIEETQSKLFSVSPNPFNESFVVNCPAAKGSLDIVDGMGKVVKSVVIKSVNTTIDFKGYASGIYLIKYQNSNESITQKIIKQ